MVLLGIGVMVRVLLGVSVVVCARNVMVTLAKFVAAALVPRAAFVWFIPASTVAACIASCPAVRVRRGRMIAAIVVPILGLGVVAWAREVVCAAPRMINNIRHSTLQV